MDLLMEESDDKAAMASSEDSEGLSDPQALLHPLIIDHIANKIFTYLGLNYSNKDILGYRQVCKCWYHVITNEIKQKSRVPELTFKHDDTHRLERFLESMKNTTNLPFDKYSFDVHFFVEKHTPLFNRFLTLGSQFITKLSLNFGKQYSLDLQSLDYNGISFHNLRSLSFKCSYLTTRPGNNTNSSCTWRPQHPQQQLKGLLSLFKAIVVTAVELDCLELHLPYGYIAGEASKLADVEFANIIVAHSAETVEQLKLTMKLDEDHLNGLRRFKLKLLHLNFWGSLISEEGLKTFINQNSGILQDLRIMDFEDIFSDWNKILPEFRKLTSLGVKDSAFYKFHPPTYFSKLETFVILTEHTSESKMKLETAVTTVTTPNDIPYPTVGEINLQYIVVSPIAIKNIPSYFPNITICRVQASDESGNAVQEICKLLKNLKELEITFIQLVKGYSVDPMITGLSVRDCESINRDSYNFNSRLLSLFGRKPCLENLPWLEKITLNITSCSITLTDVSVRYALISSPSLKMVSIIGCHNITSQAMDSMKMRVQVIEDLHLMTKLTYVHASPIPQAPSPAPNYDYSMALVPVPPPAEAEGVEND